MSDNVIPFPGAQDGPPDEELRWKAVVEYRTGTSIEVREHFFEEIRELQDMIELGPHWDTIIKCTITINRRSEEIPLLTVEQAEIM